MTACTMTHAGMFMAELTAAYAPRQLPWTDPGLDDRQRAAVTEGWMVTFARYSVEVGRASVAQARREHPDWPPNLNQFTRILQDQARTHTSEAAKPGPMCDGSGWVRVDRPDPDDVEIVEGFGTYIPCKRCNPFLHLEFQDGTLHQFGKARDDRRQTFELSAPPVKTCPRVSPAAGVVQEVF